MLDDLLDDDNNTWDMTHWLILIIIVMMILIIAIPIIITIIVTISDINLEYSSWGQDNKK